VAAIAAIAGADKTAWFEGQLGGDSCRSPTTPDRHDIHVAFRQWASRYDDPEFSGRNRARHESWLSSQLSPSFEWTGHMMGNNHKRVRSLPIRDQFVV
jgi:hypothetical protein